MGWSSGGDIFEKVADALIAEGASDTMLRNVLWPLIDALRDGDWDTWDEQADLYRDNPTIAGLFARLGRGFGGAGFFGEIDYVKGRWVLRCSAHGPLDDGDGDDPAEHDRLVRLWSAHDRDEHGGDGVVDPDALIDPSAVSA